MARLGSEAKMGYYPTPIMSLRYIAERIGVVANSKAHCLDPCCGEGHALSFIKDVSTKGTGVLWGVELDEERAKVAGMIGLKTGQGSAFEARINPLGSMGLLYLNPPYSTDDGERVEMQFLRFSTKWLAPSGVLVFIVPEHIFEKQQNRDWIGQHFSNVRIYRLHYVDYPVFKQVALFGVKRNARVEHGELIPPKPYQHIEAAPHEVFIIPETEGPTVFQVGDSVSDGEIETLKPLAREKLNGLFKTANDEVSRVSPILPLKKGHLVALLSAGVLDGEIRRNGERIIVKGFSDRVVTQIETESEVITKNTYAIGIRAIDAIEGRWYDIT